MLKGRKGWGGILPLVVPLVCLVLSAFPAEPSIPFEWTGVERVVAVADLHGDYERFVFILTHPEVGLLDEELHWTGGKAHLVQLGDIMDRGPDARKILDLLIRLEKEAAEAGGMVHVLLGNHEEMNITGIAFNYPHYITVEQFVSFLEPSYRKAKERDYLASLPADKRKAAEGQGLDPAGDESLRAFWARLLESRDREAQRAYVRGFNDAYGDWLLRKNAVIKINGIVYAHGGVSESFSRWSLQAINDLLRQELSFFQGMMRHPERAPRSFRPKIVYNPDSPLWYRGLVRSTEAKAQAEIDRILANLGARAMVVGHNYASSRLNSSSPTIDRSNVALFNEKYWVMDTGISHVFGGIPSAFIEEGGKMRVWGETEEAAVRERAVTPQGETGPSLSSDPLDFLRTASIKQRIPGPAGRTDPWRIVLESGGVMRQAVFKYVDRRRPDLLPDSYHYELAAFALDSHLGLGLVPPVVERRIEGVDGSLQIFVDDVLPEAQRRERRLRPKDPGRFDAGMADLRVFQSLVYDDCRNDRDILVRIDDGAVFKVDFSEAFAPKHDLVPRCPILKCSRRLYGQLQAWDDASVAELMRPHLNDEEIRALNARRALVVRVIEQLIKTRGEANVLF